jgi:hypothetical protein
LDSFLIRTPKVLPVGNRQDHYASGADKIDVALNCIVRQTIAEEAAGFF